MAKKKIENKSTISCSPIIAGDIKFYDNIEPPLKAGKYTLEATQSIGGVTNGGNELPSYEANKDFLVRGTQFSIKQSVIHSKYPAAMAIGSFGSTLPNVVLSDFSLPWSRPINPAKPEENMDTPWLGLLTIHPTEAGMVSKPKYVSISELVKPGLKPEDKNVQGPIIDPNTTGLPSSTQVMVVDVDFKYFQTISPSLDDLQFLAHGRAVNTDGKVMLGMDADGLFSLLIGNRLPDGGAPGSEGLDNNILMVSFEGHQDHLRGGKAPTKSKIRLVLLYSWKFKELPVKASFLADMANLCDPGSGGVSLMQMPGDISNVKNETAKKALEIGYTALQNDMRVGEQTTTWYRGPLVPTPTSRQEDLNYGTYLYGDRAIHYDPSTGIFDHSYAAAWQIGRLLALSDGAFARSLFEWRNSYILVALQAASQKTIKANVKTLAAVDKNDPLASESLVSGLQFTLGRALMEQEWPTVKSRSSKMLGSHLPGILNEEEKEEILINNEDPLLVILTK